MTYAAAVTGAMAIAWTAPGGPAVRRPDPPARPSQVQQQPAQHGTAVTQPARLALSTGGTEADDESEQPWAPAVVAEVGGVELTELGPLTELVAFHEAYSGATVPLVLADEPEEDHSGRGVDVQARDAERTAPLVVLPTRERATHPASAMDVAMPATARVNAPVTGEVVAVDPYLLYGQHPDHRIAIVPDDAPNMEVAVLHVTDPRVDVGDRVTAGRTPLAGGPTVLPFESQIDRFAEAETGRPLPHVHIEVFRRG